MRRSTPLQTLAAASLALLLLNAPEAWAEASHHQSGSNLGQVSLAGVDRLANGETAAGLDVRGFAAFLLADRKRDGNGDGTELGGNGSVQSHGLNVFAEYRGRSNWAVSLLGGGQHLAITADSGDRTLWSLTDSILGARYTLPLGAWGSLTGAASVKVPGNYPESEATGAKQVDQETRVLLGLHDLGVPRVSLLLGVGYRLRLSDIQDEIAPTVLLPVRVTSALTVTGAVTGGVAIGVGTLAKDTLTAGGMVAYRLSPAWELAAAYYRTVYGRNVVDAHVATVGAALAL